MTTKSKAAPNKLIETKCSSAISFIKVVGDNKTAIVIAYNLSLAHILEESTWERVTTTFAAVYEKTDTKMIIRKKLLIQIVKQITKIDDLPMVRYPISNMDEGLSGHTSLALRYNTALIVT